MPTADPPSVDPPLGRAGEFCWMDIKTRDLDATTTLLASVLGWAWSIDESDWRRATKARLGGHWIASVSDLASPVYPAELPDHVAYYAAVDSVDDTAARATAHGAELLVEPFEAGDQGRVATLVDPLGAAFSLWQPTGPWRPGPSDGILVTSPTGIELGVTA